ncbi:hypothetical protein Tco_1380893, partial [Tanacetum coccineum]
VADSDQGWLMCSLTGLLRDRFSFNEWVLLQHPVQLRGSSQWLVQRFMVHPIAQRHVPQLQHLIRLSPKRARRSLSLIPTEA